MAATAVVNNSLPQSKASSEKPANASPSVSSASKADVVPPLGSTNGLTDNIDNPYFRELQKNLRNALKKLNATSKVDAIVAEHPGKSLDELVAEKKINPDQKAQVLKKPALQAHVGQIEDQISHYKQFAAHYEERLASQKAALEKAHQEKLGAFQEKAVAEATESSKKELEGRLLSLSRFLCAAAAMRRSGDQTSYESRAFEGVLYQVYGGCREAVDSMLKLIDGADERVLSVEDESLDFTYGRVKLASEEYTKAAAEPSTEEAPTSDPTLANAGYTELQDGSFGGAAANTNDPTVAVCKAEQIPPPAQSLVSDAANPVAESHWESNVAGSLSSANADDWVEVPRDLAETDVGLQATSSTVDTGMKHDLTAPQHPAHPVEGIPVTKDGGSEQAAHHQRKPSSRGRGGGRGRGRGRGDFRGRGRGRGGRGRGGPNGSPAAAAGSQ